jgi:hypothetical protein
MNVLTKITGKVKYLVALLYTALVVLNTTYGLGLGEEEFQRIFYVVLIALGVDGAEGIAANLRKPKADAKPPASDTGGAPSSGG